MYSEQDLLIVKNEIQKRLDNPDFKAKLKKILKEKYIDLHDVLSKPDKILELMNEVPLLDENLLDKDIQK